MFSKFRNVVAVLFVGDLVLTWLALLLSDLARQYIPLGRRVGPVDTFLNPYIYLIVALIWLIFPRALGLYDVHRATNPMGEARTLLVAVPASVFIFAGALYLSFRDVPRLLVFYFLWLDLFLLAALRLVVGLGLRLLSRRGHLVSRVLIAGANEMGATVAGAIDAHLGSYFTWVGFADDEPSPELPILGSLADVPRLVGEHAVDEVIIALPSAQHARVEQVVQSLQSLPVQVHIVPDFLNLVMVQAKVESLAGIPLVGLREPVIDGLSWAVKRTFDLALSVMGLALAWPLMAIIALAIKLDSPGPIIFKQQRVGENGRVFSIYKFRTMHVGDEGQYGREPVAYTDDGLPLYKTAGDPRITRVGRFLRRSSLDELPQLFNVLKGEMSLVGPRPEVAAIVEGYERWQHKRLAVPPGITGWWQVSGRSDLPLHLNTQYDLFYIRNYSLLLDLKILWKTVGVVLRGKGAY